MTTQTIHRVIKERKLRKLIKRVVKKERSISLLEIFGEYRVLIASLDPFGPGYFDENVKKMQEEYFHPLTDERISLEVPTISESISIASYNFVKRVKPILDRGGLLQLGVIVKTSKGIFANPPKGEDGNLIIDEQILEQYLNKAEKVNEIYLGGNGFGFVPYGLFKSGEQDVEEFAEGGLARLLEHASGVAENLKKIASKENYPKGVKVWGFDREEGFIPTDRPALNLVSLRSFRVGDMLYIQSLWPLGGYPGYVFGVLKQAPKAS